MQFRSVSPFFRAKRGGLSAGERLPRRKEIIAGTLHPFLAQQKTGTTERTGVVVVEWGFSPFRPFRAKPGGPSAGERLPRRREIIALTLRPSLAQKKTEMTELTGSSRC